MTERFYFRQLLSGLDFALDDPIAEQMVNFVYAFGDRETGEAVLVDPAYRPTELIELVEADGHARERGLRHALSRRPRGRRASAGRTQVDGIVELLESVDVPIHVQADEVEWVTKRTGVGADSLVAHDGGDVVSVGEFDVSLIHTPGPHAGQSVPVGRTDA